MWALLFLSSLSTLVLAADDGDTADDTANTADDTADTADTDDDDTEGVMAAFETRIPDKLQPYYGFGVYTKPLLSDVPSEYLVRPARVRMQGAGVQRLIWHRPDQPPVQAWPRRGSDVKLGELPAPVLEAIIDVLKREQAGVEADLLVRDAPRSRVPVTVRWDLDGTMHVEDGPGFILHSPPERTVEGLQERWPIRLEVEGDIAWDRRVLGLLDDALARVDASEWACLRDLPFVLSSERPKGDQTILLGQYSRWTDGTARIVLYQTRWDFGATAFLGSPQAPVRLETHIMLHELGHAIHDAANRRVDPMKGMESEVVDAWAERIGESWRPTRYGQKVDSEGFADFYALLRLDRPAMERSLPDVVDWFDQGEHLRCGETGAP